ncbi:MAG: hypothetical protein LBD77_05730 [Bifidobacteriaceae bacterium]|jgi:hypothetical protein|nr:hypothetical protein [Bifidobacteriaceae bacterium]
MSHQLTHASKPAAGGAAAERGASDRPLTAGWAGSTGSTDATGTVVNVDGDDCWMDDEPFG